MESVDESEHLYEQCVNTPHLQGDAAQRKVSCGFLSLVASYKIFFLFKPITAYSIPYLVEYKGLTVFEVTNKVVPISTYGALFFIMLAAPASEYFSYWTVIQIGNIGSLIGQAIMVFGKTLFMMQIMQAVGSCASANVAVFQAYLFFLVTEDDFHLLTGINQGSISISYFLAGELGQLLVLLGVSYDILAVISLATGSVSCALGYFLPKGQAKADTRPVLLNFFSKDQGFVLILKETWKDKHLQLLSILWATLYSGSVLSLNYGTILFQGISSDTEYNGSVIAAGTACGVLVSLCYVYFAKSVSKAAAFIYVVGSCVYGILCVTMALWKSLWIAYIGYVILVCMEKLILCVLYTHCGVMINNDRYMLFFSLNTAMGWVLTAIIQAIFEIAGFDIFSEYIALGGYFMLIAVLFTTGMICFGYKSSAEAPQSNEIHSTAQPLVENCDAVLQKKPDKYAWH